MRPSMPVVDVNVGVGSGVTVPAGRAAVSVEAAALPADVREVFERVYAQAGGDPARVPWAGGAAHPLLVSWLNERAPGTVRPGARAAVVACGLGEDVAELHGRGYDAMGFDVCPDAIEWGRRLRPELAGALVVADAMCPPLRLRHRFDLVVEINTLDAVPVELRPGMLAGMASLVGRCGQLVVIRGPREHGRPATSGHEPMDAASLAALAVKAGLKPGDDGSSSTGIERGEPGDWMRGVFTRAC